MGAWGEGPLENDTAGDLEVFWEQFIARSRAKDPRFWTAARISELFRFLYFNGYDNVRPERAEEAERVLALGAIFLRHKLTLPADLKALIELAINQELRQARLQEWGEPKARKRVLEQLLHDLGGKRQKTSKPPRRPPSEEVLEIESFMKRVPHWTAVVKREERYDPGYEEAEPAFVGELKRFCFAGTKSDDKDETRRAIIARLKCLAYVTGWMLNLPSAEILRLVEAAPHVTSPDGPDYAWHPEVFAS